MSGDVQLKKRREKKKRKDDGSEEVLIHHQQQTATPLHVTDDLHIHVQKDHGTEGGICAKLVFFVLLTLLVTLIGGIISEHRGLTDLDIVGTESRFAHIFDGFIDISADEHESPELYSAAHSEEEHDDEEDDVLDDEEELSEENIDEHDESPENEDNEVEESNSADEEEEEEEEEEVDESNNDDDVAESEEVSTKDEEDVEDENENTSSNANNDESEEKDNDEDDDDEPPSYIYERKRPPIKRASYYMNKYKETHKKVSSDSQEDTVQDDSKERVHVHKVKTNSAEDRDDAIDSGEEDEKQQQSEEDELEQQPEDENEQQPDEDEEESQVKTEDGEETTAIKIEEVDEQEMPLISSDKLSEIESEKTEADEEEQEVDYISMMIKFGVGTALLVVAHVVLIQKWRKCSANEPPTSPEIKISQDEELLLDLSRRNTIVAPPKLEEIQQEIEEYSEEENDLESDEDDGPKTINIKKQYQELQSTYSQTLTPEWEPTKPEEEEEAEDVDEEQDYDAEISEDEDDDEDLLRRLEAKYGKIEQDEESYDEEENPEEEDEIEELEDDADADADYEMWKHIKRSAAGEAASSNLETEEVYKFSNITNKDDYQIKEQLDLAQENLINDTASALTRFNQILERNPSSPRALYGKAQCLDILAEQKRSNSLLQDAITIYQQVLKIKDVPDGLFQTTAERCINRMRFKGLYNQAVLIHNLLIDKYPHIIKFQNNLAVTYLTINKVESARRILQRVLTIKPNDGFALVHYGFILKTIDDKLKEAVTYLNDGIKTKEEGVIDGRFYFHLGDALIRLGKKDEAMNVFIDGVNNKVFLSKYQRSLYNVPRLTGKPWWKIEETPHITFFTNLEKKWTLIKNEGLNLLNTRGNFQPETENLRDVGDWKQFELYARGIKNIKNCKQCPVTCKLLETFTEAIGCRRGQIKFSVMHPGTHVWPHCGPTNCRLRAHLGLKIPQNTFIRVGDEIRSWEDGKILIFDDSFEHEVWHNGSDTRLILIVDFWHPDLTMQEKIGLPSI